MPAHPAHPTVFLSASRGRINGDESPRRGSTRGATPSDTGEVLCRTEEAELHRHEGVIAKGWHTFVEVGRALAAIRAGRLYRAHYPTFEAYCRDRWQYGKSYASYLIGAADVVGHLSTIVDVPLPCHEAQVRPLIGLAPEQIREVWTAAASESAGDHVTARLVREKAGPFRPPAKARPRQAEPLRAPNGNGTHGPMRAMQLLDSLEHAIRRGSTSDTILSILTALKECVQSLASAAARPEPR